MRWLNDDNELKRSTLERVLLTIVMSLYAVFGIYYIPYLLVLFPVPYIIFGLKNGIIANIINMIVTCIIVGFLDSPEYALFLLGVFLPITITILYLIKNRRSTIEILGISSVIFFISILIVLNIANAFGISFITQLEEGFTQILANQLEVLEEMDLTSYQRIKEQEALEERYRLSLLITPSVFLVASLGISYLNYFFVSLGVNKMGIRRLNRPKFSRFRLPNNIVPGVLVMFLGTLVMEKMGFTYSDVIIINLVSLIGFMLFLQGLSVADYFFIKFNILPIVRFIIFLMFLLNQSILFILTIIGILDILFNFRKIKRSKSQ